MLKLSPDDLGMDVDLFRFNDPPKRGKIKSFSVHQVFVHFEGEETSRPVGWEELRWPEVAPKIEAVAAAKKEAKGKLGPLKRAMKKSKKK